MIAAANPWRVYTHVAAFLLGLALAALGAWKVQAWRLDAAVSKRDADIAQLKQAHAEQLGNLATAARDVATKVAAANNLNQAALAAVDSKLTGERDAEKNEADRLRACVAAGTCGVRFVTRRPACPGPASDSGRGLDAAAGSVGHAALPLDADTAIAVLDLRASVRDDAAKLEYLRAYARQCVGLAAQNEQLNLHPR